MRLKRDGQGERIESMLTFFVLNCFTKLSYDMKLANSYRIAALCTGLAAVLIVDKMAAPGMRAD